MEALAICDSLSLFRHRRVTQRSVQKNANRAGWISPKMQKLFLAATSAEKSGGAA